MPGPTWRNSILLSQLVGSNQGKSIYINPTLWKHMSIRIVLQKYHLRQRFSVQPCWTLYEVKPKVELELQGQLTPTRAPQVLDIRLQKHPRSPKSSQPICWSFALSKTFLRCSALVAQVKAGSWLNSQPKKIGTYRNTRACKMEG